MPTFSIAMIPAAATRESVNVDLPACEPSYQDTCSCTRVPQGTLFEVHPSRPSLQVRDTQERI